MSDAVAVTRLAGHRRIADTTQEIPHPYDEAMAERWIASHRARIEDRALVPYAITLVDDHRLVGAISLTLEPAYTRAELGYWIGVPFWGRGFATEAAALLLNYGFDRLGLRRIHAQYLARNPASGRVLEKLGFKAEGLLRQHSMKWGRPEDLKLVGLLSDEWQAQISC